jgi:hypothetical protein
MLGDPQHYGDTCELKQVQCGDGGGKANVTPTSVQAIWRAERDSIRLD